MTYRDNSLTSFTNEEINLLKDQIKSVTIENEGLKEQCRHVTNQLDIALYQVIILEVLYRNKWVKLQRKNY